jgi:hypothetical protein
VFENLVFRDMLTNNLNLRGFWMIIVGLNSQKNSHVTEPVKRQPKIPSLLDAPQQRRCFTVERELQLTPRETEEL